LLAYVENPDVEVACIVFVSLVIKEGIDGAIQELEEARLGGALNEGFLGPTDVAALRVAIGIRTRKQVPK
jgi:hypothetical protein